MRATKIALSVAAVLAGVVTGAAPAVAAPSTDVEIDGYVATIQVVDESFKVHLTDPAAISAAFDVLNGKSNQHPTGTIDRSGPEHNTGYQWHLDTGTVRFVDMSIEVCDGKPSDVSNVDFWTLPFYCPWIGKVVKMERLPVTEEQPVR
ncbi:hypothetical protein QTQ03_20685 [Micromonospora sp. WMMA1363]|uniref:BP74-related protein n=1 Tax=Micromonospora sp. WMMA1363 TaxID=3053985 RepID=UPI00259C79AC|nr:hypothetical protein [Micromonospora sp. WMMA1363]MDM4721896.1 hypothetical protein [Micromonospora sp. WMMA1363]